jgi:hypothetical protein
MRDTARPRHDVAIVQHYLASLRAPDSDRTGRFGRRTPASTSTATHRPGAAAAGETIEVLRTLAEPAPGGK